MFVCAFNIIIYQFIRYIIAYKLKCGNQSLNVSRETILKSKKYARL